MSALSAAPAVPETFGPAPHVQCAESDCTALISERRARLGKLFVLCPSCKERRESDDPYVQVCYGFKNNGANLVRASQRAAHMEGVKVRG